MGKHLVRVVAAAALWLLLPAVARAQYTSSMTGVSWNNPMNAFLDNQISLSIQQSSFDRSMEAKFGKDVAARAKAEAAGESSAAEPAATHLHMKATDFRGGKKRLILAAMTKPEGSTAEQQAVLKQIYTAGFTEFEKAARKNNVAYACAFVIAVSLMVDRGVEISDADSEAMAVGLNDLLGGTPAFKQLKPKEKQALYEASIITGTLIAVFAQMGTEDPEMAKLSKELAGQVLAQFGL